MVYIFENSLMAKTTLHAVQLSGGYGSTPGDNRKS
jgi:hypothetical protein